MHYGRRRFPPSPQALIRSAVLAAPLGLSHVSSSGGWGDLNARCRGVQGEPQHGPEALPAPWRTTLASQLRRSACAVTWTG
jgi:hypothetical protein